MTEQNFSIAVELKKELVTSRQKINRLQTDLKKLGLPDPDMNEIKRMWGEYFTQKYLEDVLVDQLDALLQEEFKNESRIISEFTKL